MNYEQKLSHALQILLPSGGWGYARKKLTFEKGVEAPTQEAIDEQIAIIEKNEPFENELQRLDNKLPRHGEAFHLNNPLADPYLNNIAKQKTETRAKLIKE